MEGRKASLQGLDSGSEGETEHLNTGEAYQLLMNTLAPGKEVSARPSKRQKTAAGLGGVVKHIDEQLHTTARKQENGKFDRPTALNGTGDLDGKSSSQKSKRSLAAEKKKLEAEQDAVEPARVTEQHLERCTARLLSAGSPEQSEMHGRNGLLQKGHISKTRIRYVKWLEVDGARLLSDPEAAELRERRLARHEEGELQEAWPKGTWSSTGDPVQVSADLREHAVRPRLVGRWTEAHPGLPESGFTDPQQSAFFALVRSYKDVFFPAHPYTASAGDDDPITDAALLHCLDHIASTAQRIKKNKDLLKADSSMEPPRDQGFTRPKVLLLLPMRNMAFRLVSRLLVLAQKETRTDSVQGKARFLDEFGLGEAEGTSKAELEARRGRPAEHTALFAGNTDDHFRLGIKLTRGQVKLYSDFFQSDIIVASPIALATKLADKDSPEEVDFLSSVEIVVAARCDVCQMQNWSHMVTVFGALNGMPKDLHGADVMRVREWYLAGRGADYRQNILLSSFLSPELHALFSNFCHSHAGKAKLQITQEGVLGSTDSQVHQIFEKFHAKSHAADIERRFEQFKARFWPRIRDSASGGQMLFVPSYLDYVRLRSFLRAEEVEFEGLSEYADGGEVARGRSRFAKGETRLALYTERAHFYHRRFTRGVKDLYIYQLPEHAHYYTELLNLLTAAEGIESGHTTVTALFSKFDALRLERIVGNSRSQKMLKAASKTFLFS